MTKKIRILESTERLLARHGFEHLSMQLVAKEADVAIGTIYRYFTDKNDLLNQLRLHVLTQCAEKLLLGIDVNYPNKAQFSQLWKNAWTFSYRRDDDAINREQFDSLPRIDDEKYNHIEREIFISLETFFTKGVEQKIFKPLQSNVLSSIGIEPAFCLARKQLKGTIKLDENGINQVIDACWDAITYKTLGAIK